ncbi:MAG TPA: cupin domain-containing protein [Solirubrobacterales bacterium]|nr:cupin domain-containing protein [Solirubrobacterales bacterium]
MSEVKDAAPGFGADEFQEARFAREDLEAEQTGLSHIKVKPGKRMPFGHKHDEAEEIYVVIAGSGRIKLDDEIVEVTELDAIRVSPEVARCMEAGPEGLSVLVVGAHHDKDGEVLPNWWVD